MFLQRTLFLSVILLALFASSLARETSLIPSKLKANPSYLPKGYVYTKNGVDISRGVLMGILTQMKQPAACVCFRHIGDIFSVIEQIYLWNYYSTSPTATDILLMVKDFILNGLAEFGECQKIPSAFLFVYDTIVQGYGKSKEISFWFQVAVNVISGTVSSIADREDLSLAYNNGDFLLLGEEIGTILYSLFLYKFD